MKSIGVKLPAGVGVDADIGATQENKWTADYHGKQSSRRTITGSILQNNTVGWTFKEATNGLGGDGLAGEQIEMWFVLSGKPDSFEYDCRVTHVKDRKEKVKQAMSKSWFQKYF